MTRGRSRAHRGGRPSVSASELAQMGVCEQLVQFEHRYGRRHSPQQHADMMRGDREHRRFFLEGRMERKGRCFIATLVYGEGAEVAVLRSCRDQVLRATLIGRAFIFGYYRMAPGVCHLLEGHPHLARVTRALLRPVVWMAARVLSSRRRAGR